MKKLLLSIITMVTITATMVSCGSKETPKDVAINFTKELNALNYDGAKKFGTPETVKFLDMLASFSSMVPDSLKESSKNLKVEAVDEVINGDNAEVRIKNGDKGDEKIHLVKTNGKWLVNMSKDNSMGGEGDQIPLEESDAPADDSNSVAPVQEPADAPAH
ncbi:MAG: DUF4878 domain-containing protein [Chitinophagaceae bacterium]|nr:DUF4878 domain-containing protein [Chitinophagaceae bacterium]